MTCTPIYWSDFILSAIKRTACSSLSKWISYIIFDMRKWAAQNSFDVRYMSNLFDKWDINLLRLYVLEKMLAFESWILNENWYFFCIFLSTCTSDTSNLLRFHVKYLTCLENKQSFLLTHTQNEKKKYQNSIFIKIYCWWWFSHSENQNFFHSLVFFWIDNILVCCFVLYNILFEHWLLYHKSIKTKSS